jgi:transposase-like protein
MVQTKLHQLTISPAKRRSSVVVVTTLEQMLEAELTEQLGSERYEGKKLNSRNGKATR